MTSPTPFIILLNSTGDVTITWTEDSKEAVIALIKDKMKKGYQFMVLKPRFLRILGTKKEVLSCECQLQNAVGLSVPDDQALDILSAMSDASKAALGDSAVEKLVAEGNAKVLRRASSHELEVIRPASSVEEVLCNQCIAIPVIVGG